MIIGNDTPAIVAGGASGLGVATVKALKAAGAKVSILDINREAGERVAQETGTDFQFVDVTDPKSVDAAIKASAEIIGPARIAVICAGICPGMKTVTTDRTTGKHEPHDLATFIRAINVNLIGTFNVASRAAAVMAGLPEINDDKERGVIIMTSSIAAEDGQIGQAAYAASKAGVKGLTLPMARDLSRNGVRVYSIMPGIFETPMLAGLPEDTKKSLAKDVPFPPRLGNAPAFAALALAVVANPMLNGSSVRLDGALRMPPR